MRKRKVVSAAFTGVAVTGIAGLAAAPALAGAGGWTVRSGGHYTAKNTTVVDKFHDTTKNITIGCTKSAVKASGNILNSTSRQGKSIGTVSHYSPGKGAGLCSAEGLLFSGANFTTFHLNAISQKASGIVRVTITNFGVKFKGAGINRCVISVGGKSPSATGTYNNSTGLLDIFAATTSISHVANCPFVKSGDHISISAPITITTVNGKAGHPKINDP